MANIKIFDKWTETSAYIFGFWVADGHIYLKKSHGKYYKMFCITNTDLQIMDKMAEKLQHPVYKESHINTIKIYSDELFDFCYNATSTIHKINMLSIPNLDKATFRHFVRGFFDGDGSIHIKRYKNRHGKITSALQTSFTASAPSSSMLEDLKNKIREQIPELGNKKICTYKSGSGAGSKLAFNQYDSALLCSWMYRNAKIYMARKKDVWDNLDHKRLFESKKYFGRNKT